MKDIWLFSLTALALVLILVTGQFLQGDYADPTYTHKPISGDAGQYAVEKDGRLLLNINAVDAETLSRLDGIGETLCRRIVEYREEYGAFVNLDELLKVDGIGTRTLGLIREHLICLPPE